MSAHPHSQPKTSPLSPLFEYKGTIRLVRRFKVTAESEAELENAVFEILMNDDIDPDKYELESFDADKQPKLWD